jgi:hypothetical protein
MRPPPPPHNLNIMSHSHWWIQMALATCICPVIPWFSSSLSHYCNVPALTRVKVKRLAVACCWAAVRRHVGVKGHSAPFLRYSPPFFNPQRAPLQERRYSSANPSSNVILHALFKAYLRS